MSHSLVSKTMNNTEKTKVNYTEMIILPFMSESALNLTCVAARLEALEETIIYKLLDRAQFAENKNAYVAGRSGFADNATESLFEIRLLRQETMDAEFGRFQVPEERPFSRGLPAPKRKALIEADCLSINNLNTVNLCDQIKSSYLSLLQKLCRDSFDGHFGSSVECDVAAVQSISRRIHFGSFYIAECKFRDSQEEYTSLIKNSDLDGLLERLTRRDIEDQITSRIYDKICSIQSDVNQLVRQLIDPEIIVTFYRDTIIPLTKQGELLYLMNRQFD